MNKKILIGLIVPLCMGGIASLASCGQQGEKIDPTKTQIYVNNFRRGFGSEWLSALKTRFEAAHAEDTHWEEGKKGVEIIIHNVGTPADSRIANILTGIDEVYFTEQSYYYSFLNYNGQNLMGDITDVVEQDLTDLGDEEGRTIEDKLTAEQKNYYNVGSEENPQYYALPHYAGYFGIQYDVDLFDTNGFYYAAENLSVVPGDRGEFVSKHNSKKSAGPDGIEGTYDDGLPRTYDEFFNLCDYMIVKNCVPLISTGQNANDYLNLLVNGFAADHAGKEEMSNKFKSSGVMTDLCSGFVNGEPVPEANPVTLNKNNGYEAYRMIGNYYGISFLKRLLSNPSYVYDKVTSTAFSAKAAQDELLIRYTETSSKKIAMISEGIWWENESKTVSDDLATRFGPAYSSKNRRFAFMPFPKATEERYAKDNTNTLFDHLFSLMFMKANVAEWKVPLVKEFIRFANTDTSLREFTKITNTPKALEYELTDADKNEMTYYGRTLAELKESSDVVYPGNNSTVYRLNSTFFHTDNQYSTIIDNTENKFVWGKINSVTAQKYFEGMDDYYKRQWSNLNLG